MEYAGYYGGIHFYNDSIATVPEATIHAVKTLKEVDTLILGGYDRGIDYSALVAFLQGSSVSNLIFTGQAGDRIRKMFGPLKPTCQRILVAEHFEEVMDLAKKYTRKGRICLLSPAAASYDWFADFKERGRRFKELARGLSSWQATDTPELK
jgi:UDP-N-acetylmuramoylalanine--D-glutamate ligase